MTLLKYQEIMKISQLNNGQSSANEIRWVRSKKAPTEASAFKQKTRYTKEKGEFLYLNSY